MDIKVNLPEKLSFLFEPHRYKVLWGGRGSSKSWSVARTLLVMSMQNKLRVLCCREIQRSIRDSVHRLIGDQIQLMGLGQYFEVTQTEIRCTLTGSQFLFSGLATNTVESIKSFENVNICWIEEGQTVSESSWSILTPTIRAPGSEIWITMNPELDTDPTYVRFVSGATGLPDCKSVQVNFIDNPYFPEVLRDEMRHLKESNYDSYRHVWLGECKRKSDAAVFDPRKISVREFVPDEINWSPLFGIDWGYAIDPTVMTKCWFSDSDKTLYIEYEVVLCQTELELFPAHYDGIPGSRNHLCRADNARPEMVNYMKRNGFPKVNACQKWKGSIEDGIDCMRSMYEIVVHPRCPISYSELINLRYKVDRITGDILPEIAEKTVMVDTPNGPLPSKDNCIDSIRYGLEAIILGYRRKLDARPENTQYDSIGKPVRQNIGVTAYMLSNPHAWIS